MQNDDSTETLRKLLADASMAAAKANLSDNEDDEEDNDEVDDGLSGSDDPFTNTTSASVSANNTELEEVEKAEEAEERTLRQTDSDEASSPCSSASFDAGRLEESGNSAREGESEDLWTGSLSETERAQVQAAVPRAAVPLVRCLAQDLISAQAQIKRLRSRVRRLGQRLTDQEAAADEAIERLCLRCHNLETRLADAQTLAVAPTTTLEVGGAETPTPSDGRGRLSPVPEQGEDTEETEEETATATTLNEDSRSCDIQTKYSSLLALYESVLQREENLKRDLAGVREKQGKVLTANVECQTDRTPEFEDDSTVEERGRLNSDGKALLPPVDSSSPSSSLDYEDEDESTWQTVVRRPKALSSNDRRTIDSSTTPATAPCSRSAALPPRDSGSPACLSEVRRYSSLDTDAPPPRPPKPLSCLSPLSSTTSLTVTDRLNLAALPDSERELLNVQNPFVALNSHHLYELHMQRIRVGTSGAFSRKRPPSRFSTIRTSTHDSPSLNPSTAEVLSNATSHSTASAPSLPISTNSAFYPAGPHPLVDAFHDTHVSVSSNYYRAMSQPHRPSPTEQSVRSPDWTESTSPECQNRWSLLHHYPRFSPSSGSPHSSPAKSAIKANDSSNSGIIGRKSAMTRDTAAPLFPSKHSPLVSNSLQTYGPDDPLPY
ncbi:hypothetical protein TSMEX_001049 [Taenia solium]|eukprot:TsM_000761200 transcript=TsM_000761200 gene=TsM_000761200